MTWQPALRLRLATSSGFQRLSRIAILLGVLWMVYFFWPLEFTNEMERLCIMYPQQIEAGVCDKY
jgi:hypothetical protein